MPMQTSARLLVLVPAVLAAVFARSLAAQAPPAGLPPTCAGGIVGVELPGGYGEETRRARGLRAGVREPGARRSADSARARLRDTSVRRFGVALVAPEILVTSQSDFPLPANDGPMWAGRGLTRSITAGIAVCGARGRWGAIVAPTFWRAENAAFPLVDDQRIAPSFKDNASFWSSPYHFEPRSLDQPRRFGPDPVGALDPGVLALWWRGTRVETGVTTESEWWGPGLRNALLLSSQAAGVPRIYVRTARPLRLAGDVEAQAFLGSLSWSRFFRNTLPADTSRSLAGAMITWRPWFDEGLQFGVARLVASPIAGNGWFAHVLDPIRRVGRPNAVGIGDSLVVPGPDQLFEVFARWQLPDDGTEVWLEWGRAEEPENLVDLLRAPNHSQALTIGLMHVRPLARRGWHWRVAAEYTQTNQTGSFRERPSGSWYVSRPVPGGFTQRGQVLGAAIGSGSVAQSFAFDLSAPSASGGVFVERVKWDEDSFYTIPRPIGNGLCKHDVSLSWGARAGAATRAGWFDVRVATQRRLNLYWQALGFCFANEQLQVDARNVSLSFRYTPRLGPQAAR